MFEKTMRGAGRFLRLSRCAKRPDRFWPKEKKTICHGWTNSTRYKLKLRSNRASDYVGCTKLKLSAKDIFRKRAGKRKEGAVIKDKTLPSKPPLGQWAKIGNVRCPIADLIWWLVDLHQARIYEAFAFAAGRPKITRRLLSILTF